MKRVFFILGLSFCILGCDKASVNDNNQGLSTEGKKVVVSLGLGGEFTISETPLSRTAGSETASNDLYGLNVYYDKEKDGVTDDNYACGLFDNVADMVITLNTEHKYKFECRMVVNGKVKCSNSSTTYWSPFVINEKNPLQPGTFCDNVFYYETGVWYVQDYFRGGVTANNGYLADTYYGEVNNYSPQDNGVVSIDMKRCVYGLTVNVSGVTRGEATIGINTDYGTAQTGVAMGPISEFKESYTITTDQTVLSEIISFNNVYDCWSDAVAQGEYRISILISFHWTYPNEANSVKEAHGYYAVRLKRNYMTNVDINLNINTNQIDNGVNLTLDTSPLIDQDYVFNCDVTIDG